MCAEKFHMHLTSLELRKNCVEYFFSLFWWSEKSQLIPVFFCWNVKVIDWLIGRLNVRLNVRMLDWLIDWLLCSDLLQHHSVDWLIDWYYPGCSKKIVFFVKGIPAPRSAQVIQVATPGSTNSLIPAPSSSKLGDRASHRQSRSNSNTSSGISIASSTSKAGSSNWSTPPPQHQQSGIPPSAAVNHTALPAVGTAAAPSPATAAMGKTSMFGFGFFHKKQEKSSTSSSSSSSNKVTALGNGKQLVERNSGCSSSSGFSSGSGKSELSDNSSTAGSDTLMTSPILSVVIDSIFF